MNKNELQDELKEIWEELEDIEELIQIRLESIDEERYQLDCFLENLEEFKNGISAKTELYTDDFLNDSGYIPSEATYLIEELINKYEKWRVQDLSAQSVD